MDADDADIPTSCNFLKKPFLLGDLVGNGTNFEINADFDEGFTNDIFEELNLGTSDEDDDGDEADVFADEKRAIGGRKKRLNPSMMVSPWTKPFAELREKMQVVNEHIQKEIVIAGDEDTGLVPANARVHVRYNAYWEGETTPFDSSHLRGNSFSFYTGHNDVLPGLDAAVRSMYRGEKSNFIISYHLLFREMGCPPRIKPRADGLFVIECVHFNEVGNLDADKDMLEEERCKYAAVLPKVREVHLKGLDFFRQRSYANAGRAFEKAVNMLSYCRLTDQKQEKERDEFLLKLFLNLTVCYNKINAPNKTCLVAKQIRELTNQKPPCKALFQEGKAFHLLGEYTRARNLLLSAQRMEPQNNEIGKELLKLHRNATNFKRTEQSIWTKAFGMLSDKQLPADNKETSVEFEQEMTEIINAFKANEDTNSMQIPDGYTDKEIDIIKELAQRLNVRFEVLPLESKIYKLHKC